jgi:hypothetical protein
MASFKIAPLNCELCYSLKGEVSDYASGGYTFKVQFGGFTTHTIGTVEEDGEFDLQFTLPCLDLKGIVFGEALQWDRLIIEKTGVSSLHIEGITLDEVCYEEYCSEPICLDDDPHDCDKYVALAWTNDRPAFGFEYPPGFQFTLLTKGDVMMESHLHERERFRLPNGKRIDLNAETTRNYMLKIGFSPEYVHQAIALGLIHNDFFADGKSYTMAERGVYDIIRDIYPSEFNPAEVDIEPKISDLKNRTCK